MGFGDGIPTANAPFMKPKLVPPWNMYRLMDMSCLRTSVTTGIISVKKCKKRRKN